MIYCTEGHKIDDTNESYGGIICGICGGTFAVDSDVEAAVPDDEEHPTPETLDDLQTEPKHKSLLGNNGSK